MDSKKVGIVSISVFIALLVLWPFLQSQFAPSPGIVFQEAPPPKTVASSLVSPDTPPVSKEPSVESPAAPLPLPQMVVHVTGAVKKPGVYDLPLDSRVKDALKAAGGAKADANLDALNLAARVEDGAQLYFPTQKEQPKGPAQVAYEAGESPIVQTKPEPKKTTVASASAPSARSATSRSSRSGKLMTPGQGTVNINTADATTLQKLPGIGPAMAERILTFRQENGGFTAPEDLLQVSGIGPKKFERMQPFVRVK